MKIKLRKLETKDLEFTKTIYDFYVLNSTVTFHKEELTIDELKTMILAGHPKYKSFIISHNGVRCGYCYLTPFNKRPAYERTAEITIYLKPVFMGKGIGKVVLGKIEKIAGEQDIHVLVGFISEGNDRSVQLFENCGYQKCAHFKQVGEKFGRKLDVVAYQKIIRSM